MKKNSIATINARPAIISCNAFTRLCHYDRKNGIEVTQQILVTSNNPIHHVTTKRKLKKFANVCVFCSRRSECWMGVLQQRVGSSARPKFCNESDANFSPATALWTQRQHPQESTEFIAWKIQISAIVDLLTLPLLSINNSNCASFVCGPPCQLGSTRPWVDSRVAGMLRTG